MILRRLVCKGNQAAGSVVINSPRYLVIEFNQAEQEQVMADEDVMSISRRIMEKNKEAYEVLAR